MVKNAVKEINKIFLNTQKKAEKHDFSLNKPRTVAAQTTRCNANVDSSEEYYRVAIYIPFLDCFISNLKERFAKHKSFLAGFQISLPTDPSSLNMVFEKFNDLVSFYRNDLIRTIEELNVEIELWNGTIIRMENDQRPKDALTALDCCKNMTMLPNIKTLLSILAVLPVSPAENERTFSVLRRLKNYLRNSTAESRLNGLTLLHLYRELNPKPEQILDKMAETPRKLDIKLIILCI